jgi:restriction system protein
VWRDGRNQRTLGISGAGPGVAGHPARGGPQCRGGINMATKPNVLNSGRWSVRSRRCWRSRRRPRRHKRHQRNQRPVTRRRTAQHNRFDLSQFFCCEFLESRGQPAGFAGAFAMADVALKELFPKCIPEESAYVNFRNMGRRRRGFFAEMAHQQRQAELQQQRANLAAEKAARNYERAVRAHERAVTAAERASDKERAAAVRAAKAAHIEAEKASAESQTAAAVEALEEIDSILAATLEVDDYVEIDSLKHVAVHPPFAQENLKAPVPAPQLEAPPPEPQFVPPPATKGILKMFAKQRHAQVTADAQAAWAAERQKWLHYVNRVLPDKHARALEAHAVEERTRVHKLEAALVEYQNACEAREREVTEANRKIDEFRAALDANDPEAIQQYVGVVLGNSVYPNAFEVEHDFTFDPELGELTVAVIVPPPSSMPTAKAYKYVAASDEVKIIECSQKEQRERYNRAIAAVAVRTFHEVFESDRIGRIKTISLTVQAEAVNPATGLFDTYRFVAAAADREEFARFRLEKVNPAETLSYMRCSVSKNAFDLKPISTARGVR